MIKTLRRKFIVISTVALLLVLVTIIGSISFASFTATTRRLIQF